MYCISCGKPVDDAYAFCPYCGAALPSLTKPAEPAAPAIPPLCTGGTEAIRAARAPKAPGETPLAPICAGGAPKKAVIPPFPPAACAEPAPETAPLPPLCAAAPRTDATAVQADKAPVAETEPVDPPSVPPMPEEKPEAVPVVPVYAPAQAEDPSVSPMTEVKPEAVPVIPVYARSTPAEEAPEAPAAEPAFPDHPIFGQAEPLTPVYLTPAPVKKVSPTRKFSPAVVTAIVFFGFASLLGILYTLTAMDLLVSWEYIAVLLCAVAGIVLCCVFGRKKSWPYLIPICLYFLLCCYAPLQYLIHGSTLTGWVAARLCLNVLALLLTLLFGAFPTRNRTPLFVFLILMTLCVLVFNVGDLLQIAFTMLFTGRSGEMLRIICTDFMDYTMILGSAFILLATRRQRARQAAPAAQEAAQPANAPAEQTQQDTPAAEPAAADQAEPAAAEPAEEPADQQAEPAGEESRQNG